MCPTLEGVESLVAKKALGARDARKKWCQCVDELSKMLHLEAINNPRYNNLKSEWNEPPPTTTRKS
jgi:hypothetical protein